MGLIFNVREYGSVTMMRTQQIIKIIEGVFVKTIKFERGKPKTDEINDFFVKPGVPFELRIDLPPAFVKEGAGEEEVEMEYYRAEMDYDDADHFVYEFALDRKYFPFWQIQAIYVCLLFMFLYKLINLV
jgi:hypothetical protein